MYSILQLCLLLAWGRDLEQTTKFTIDKSAGLVRRHQESPSLEPDEDLSALAEVGAEVDAAAGLEEAELGAGRGKPRDWRLKKWQPKLQGKGETIGKGSFGTVLKAKLKCGAQQSVAVKIQTSNGRGWEEEIASEVAAMEAFNNRRFVQMYDQGWGPGSKKKHSIMMQLATGGDLAKYTRSARYGGTTASMPDVLRLTAEILEGLAEMHAKNIVHRDVKPGNIFVHCRSGSCHAKVADLGLACLMPGKTRHVAGVRRCDGFGGTPIYLAPEIAALFSASARQYTQVSGTAAIQPANDVFAVGLMMYELIFQQHSPAVKMNSEAALYKSLAGISESWVPSTLPGAWKSFPGQAAAVALMKGMLKRSMTARISAADAAAEARQLYAQALAHTGQKAVELGEESLDDCFAEDITSPGASGGVAPQARPAPSARRQPRPKPAPARKPQRAPKEEDDVDEADGEADDADAASVVGDKFAVIRGVKVSIEPAFIFKGLAAQLLGEGGIEATLDYASASTAGKTGPRKYGPLAFREGRWEFLEVAGMPAAEAWHNKAGILEGAFGRDIVVRARRLA